VKKANRKEGGWGRAGKTKQAKDGEEDSHKQREGGTLSEKDKSGPRCKNESTSWVRGVRQNVIGVHWGGASNQKPDFTMRELSKERNPRVRSMQKNRGTGQAKEKEEKGYIPSGGRERGAYGEGDHQRKLGFSGDGKAGQTCDNRRGRELKL